MVTYKDVKLMIDGLQNTRVKGLSGLSDELTEEIIKGEGEFSHNDYLFFTHDHEDHFSVELLKKYSENNDFEKVFFPELLQGTEALKEFLESHSLDYHVFNEEEEELRVTHEITIKGFKTSHLVGTTDPQHYCYLMRIGHKNLLFTGDAHVQQHIFERQLKNEKIDVLFVNPLFINRKEGRKIISEVIKPDLMCVYHMPFPEEDVYRFERLVQRDLSKYEEAFPKSKVFRKTYEVVEI